MSALDELRRRLAPESGPEVAQLRALSLRAQPNSMVLGPALLELDERLKTLEPCRGEGHFPRGARPPHYFGASGWCIHCGARQL